MTDSPSPIEGDVIFYTTGDGAVHVEVLYQDETFWLSQRRMAELFALRSTRSTITSKRFTSPANDDSTSR